jgi:MFS family permease
VNDAAVRTPRSYRIACAFFFFISGFGYSSWASRIPSIKQQLHLNEAQLGAVLFALPIGLMATMPLTGWLLRKFSSRSIMMIGAVFYNLVICLPGFTGYLWQLALVLLMFGSARNLLNIATNAQGVEVQALHSKSIMTSFHGIWSLAGFSGAALGYFMVKFNVAPGYHLLGVSIVLLILSIYAYPKNLHQEPSREVKPLFSLPDKTLMRFAFITFASMACENTMYDWSSIYFQNAIHGSKAAATAAFVIYMVAMTTGRFLGDKMVTRYGINRLLNYSGICIFIGLMLAVLFPYEVTVDLGFIFVGFGVCCIVPLVYSLAGRSKTMSSATALASVSTIGYLGFLIVPPFVGFVAQLAGLRWSFGAIALLGGMVVWLVRGIKEE